MSRKNHPQNSARLTRQAAQANYAQQRSNILCGDKRQFRNENEAEKVIFIRELQNPGLHLRCYRCTYCPGWHLTSSSTTH